MSERIFQLEVLRYRPEQDKEPFFQTYSVPCEEEWVVLDALNYIKDEIDRTLSYRWSCHVRLRELRVQDRQRPKLGCKAFLRDYKDKILEVEPLDNFPIERDLVVVIDDFIEKPRASAACTVPRREAFVRRRVSADTGAAQDVQAILDVHQLSALLFGLPAIRVDRSGVYRPGGARAGAPLQQRPATSAMAREDVVAAHEGVWGCSFVGACSVVCPKDVDPAGAIQQMKFASAVDYLTGMVGI